MNVQKFINSVTIAFSKMLKSKKTQRIEHQINEYKGEKEHGN